LEEDLRRRIVEKLKEVYDPEIPINVWDLGLIYGVEIEEEHVKVTMTMTALFCPLASFIVGSVKRAVEEVEGVGEVTVRLTFEPRWTPARITQEGREEFKRKYGFDIVEVWMKRVGLIREGEGASGG